MGALAVVAVPAGLALALFVLERLRPLRRARAPLVPRLRVNAILSALTLATAALAVRPVAVGVLRWTSAERVGLLAASRLPAPLAFAAAVLLLDLSFYYWHRANHRLRFLWRFHNVHHVDPDLDVTTAVRFHFGEVALSAGFRALQVLVVAPSTTALLVYEGVFQANTLFHHSNLRLPLRLERALSWLLVTPRMHGIHHSQVRGETDSNYSVVLPWWDWLHRSLRLGIPQAALTVGVPGYAQAGDNRLAALLSMPFRGQRDYWGSLDRPARSGEWNVGPRTLLE